MLKRIKKSLILFLISVISFVSLGVITLKDKLDESKYVFASTSKSETNANYSAYGGILENLQEKYPDIKGWINVEGTKISYPLVQSTDNEYYVRRAYDGTDSKSGSIIVDYRLNSNLSENQNIILYGHNLASGNMFAYLANPKKFINAEIEIYSNGILTIYKPYAAYTDSGNGYIVTEFGKQSEIAEYVENGIAKSMIDFNTSIPESPYLLTMITCENTLGLGDKRIVIQAVRTSVYLP